MDQHEIKKAFAIRAMKRVHEINAKIKALKFLGVEIAEFERCNEILQEIPSVLFAKNDFDYDNIIEFTLHHCGTKHNQTDESFIQNVIDYL
jgi:hypothetical protein